LGEVIDEARNKLTLIRVQRLINIKRAKDYCTVSNVALCIITGLTPIDTTQEAIEYYQLTKASNKEGTLVDRDTEVKDWNHPAEKITLPAENNEDTSTIQIFTDGSKSELGVGAGVAIFTAGTHLTSLQYKLNNSSTSNQAEQLAILKALQYTENLQKDKEITIYTDSRVAMDSLKNSKIHTFLIDEIRSTNDKDGKRELENSTILGQGSYWDSGKRTSRYASKGGSCKHRHHGMLQQNSQKCSENRTWQEKCR